MNEELTFGPWLKQRRRLLALTQADLAERAACSLSTLRKLEAGELLPSQALAQALAVALAVPVAEQPAFIIFARSEQRKVAAAAFGNAPTQASAIPAQPLPPVVLPAQSTITTPKPQTTISAPPSARLPTFLTALIGRAAEIETGNALLRDPAVRLVTLSGPPGTGKTRLGLAIAVAVQPFFRNGVYFAPLAALRDPALVAENLLDLLGVTTHSPAAAIDTLVGFLRDKELLLVLDNFEQLIAGAQLVVDLLQRAPGLKLLVTSRTLLKVYGEHEFPVPPLATPRPGELAAEVDLTRYPALELFVQRAQAVQPELELTRGNAPLIAQICAALDGLPLAIEMAAARCKLYPLPILLQQLQQRLAVLTSSVRNLPPRQQTLRATLAWSYQLLTPAEQQLLNHLAVFVGGCTGEAIATVMGQGVEVELGLQALVDHSLLGYEMSVTESSRYTLLETVREYGAEQLTISGCRLAAQQAHAAYFRQLAQKFAFTLDENNRKGWLDRLEIEHANLRAALTWCAEHDPEAGLQLAVTLHSFWHLRGHLQESYQWFRRFLGHSASGGQLALQARALQLAGISALRLSHTDEAAHLLQTSLTLYQQLANPAGVVEVLLQLGNLAAYQNDYSTAQALYQQALALNQPLGDQHREAQFCSYLGTIAKDQGDFASAGYYYHRCRLLFQQLGKRIGLATALNDLSDLAYWQADFAQAAHFAEESLAIHRQVDNKLSIAYALTSLGSAWLQQGKLSAAAPLFAESMALFQSIGDKNGTVIGLENLGRLAMAQGQRAAAQHFFQEGITLAWQIRERQRLVFCLEGLCATLAEPTQAVQLYSAAAGLRTAINAPIPPFDRNGIQAQVAQLRQHLGATEFAAAWAAGQALALEEVVALALRSRAVG